ncbi:MAG: hypothetical protein Q7W45_01525 [Bacteroidota bacterium]|nr:hypothetical protein [Bacteroidota bacterium]
MSFLNEANFLRFDANLYLDIKNNGYRDEWLCAFFPAFPYFWKLLNVSAIGISIVNAVIFILSFSAIATLYKIEWKRQLFLLSIPSFIFMFVPYTEPLFFATGTFLIIGLNKNKLGLILIGLLFGSLIRPTTFVFIPAILISYVITERYFKQGLTKSIAPILVLITGLLLTTLVHYFYTNKWFVFFEAQKLWKNYFHLPQLPLTSWGGDASNRFDGSALAISLFCGVYLVYLFFEKLKNKISLSKDFVFSMSYITGTSLLILAYRDGNLYSLNRFIYATPFIIVSIHYFFSNYHFNWKHVWIIFFTSEGFWLLFGSYNHIHNLLMFSTVSLYFIFLLFTKHKNKTISTISLLSLIIINSIGLIKLYYRFLNNGWVG